MQNSYKGKTGLKRIYNACLYSIAGLQAAFKHEDAFRLELFIAIILIPTAFFLPTSHIEKALLIASVLFVLVIELLNSALEAAVDHTSLQEHQLAKRAKDLGSAAVTVSLILTASIWGIVLLT